MHDPLRETYPTQVTAVAAEHTTLPTDYALDDAPGSSGFF